MYLLVSLFWAFNVVWALPVSQPVYGEDSSSAPQHQIQYQAIPQELLQHQGFPLYQYQARESATPVKESEQNEAQPSQAYASQPVQQIYRSNVDRQVQLAQQQTYQPQSYQPQSHQPQSYQPQSHQPQAQTQYRVVQQPIQQAPQVRYVQQAAPPRAKAARLGPKLQPQEEEPEDYDPHPSYQFGFDVKDDLYTNYHNRQEQRDGDKISGSYSVVDSDGFIRTVTYTADPKEGFKAEVNRQPTDIVVKIPTPAPQLQQLSSGLRHQQTQQYLQASSPVARIPQQKQKIVYDYQQ